MLFWSRLAFLGSILAAELTWAANSFENTAIVRTIELGGSLVHVTTTYAVKALDSGSNIYTIALGEREDEKTSWIEARLKGQRENLALRRSAYDPDSHTYLYDIELPDSLSTDATANIVVETVQTHATYPWPPQARQMEDQRLKYETEAFVLSPYHTVVQRTKARTSSPQIIAYTVPDGLEAFTQEDTAVKAGSTITYGPYHNVPPSTNSAFIDANQRLVTVHYSHDYPVLQVSKLKRAAEVSHWGANLNIQDEFILRNAGPTLKGQFSRLDYQAQSFYGKVPSHVLSWVTLLLPPGIRNVYYLDQIGNVSTSRFRPAASIPKGTQGTTNQFSVFEIRPRYPVLGGWNYTFTLGWDSPLEDSTAYDPSTGKYLLAVPTLTPIPDAVVNEAEVKIILPEGATDIEITPPYPAIKSSIDTHITYLDTTGRPALTFEYQNMTDKHASYIYVSYRVPFAAHLRKPFAVATAFMVLFTVGMGWRRVDTRLNTKQKV